LRAGSAAEAGVVAAAADRYGAGFWAVQVRLEPGPNLEARAREARFAALPAGVVTGHTADDQAETMLMALLRGAGPDGLAGMAAAGHPILDLRRSETAALCRSEGLVPVDDPSNRDPGPWRNQVRHRLLPLMAEIAGRDPVPLLVRAAGLLRDDLALLDGIEAVDPADARALTAAPPAAARRSVRAWLTATGASGYPPSLASVDRVLAVARGEARACEVADVGRVSRHGQRLEIDRQPGGPLA
jgi:tRNA(Ile)-lysidine synthase